MSTTLHQYPPAFSHLPTPSMVDQHQHHLAAQHMGPSPLDTLAHTSQYALQFHHNRHVLPNGKAMMNQHKRMPYTNGPLAAAPRNQRDAMLHERARGAAAAGPVRRRISRACDQCNQLRTKCDGKAPVSIAQNHVTSTANGRLVCPLHRFVPAGQFDSCRAVSCQLQDSTNPVTEFGLTCEYMRERKKRG